ncbi:hypothetical protein FOA52_005955 [Chlamydomonas sp. UWO 241]|nr:hypothetical protein FOA52_005955 [Chlamydomonas sp. UWO 241]
MADSKDAGPSGSGRGGGRGGRGGGRKPKFVPTVPSRRKKDGAGGGEAGVSAAEAAAINEEFADLIKAAETGTGWQGRGRGRGGPGGRGGGQTFQVVFGGSSNDRAQLAPAKERPKGPPGAGGGGGGGVGGGGGGGSGGGEGGGGGGGGLGGAAGTGGTGGSGSGAGAKVKPEDAAGGADALDERKAAPGAGGYWGDEKKFDVADALDYNQYYPTMLPLRAVGAPPRDEAECDEVLGARVFGDPMKSGDAFVNAAAELGLDNLDNEATQNQLFLVQLPAVLPISAASRAAALAGGSAAAEAAPGGGGAAAEGGEGAGGAAGPSSAAAGPSSAAAARAAKAAAAAGGGASEARGCGLKELPSGAIGKLLIYKSGKVKLRLGDVLMDVSPGLPCRHRIDVAAINCGVASAVLLGDVAKRMVVSPDIWHLMASPDVEPASAPATAQANGGKVANGGGAEGDEPMEEVHRRPDAEDTGTPEAEEDEEESASSD